MMRNDFDFPYPSLRYPVYCGRSALCTSQQLAAEAGLEILRSGGNAIDAAVAAAACLTVLEPQSNGIGGDAFAIVHTGGRIYGLNASGWSGKLCTLDAFKRMGYEKMPQRGIHSVTVPGVPWAWAALSNRFGKKSLAENLARAIDYAENGFIISPIMHRALCGGADLYRKALTAENSGFQTWFDLFAPQGKIASVGEKINRRAIAKSLSDIAKSDAREFYEGDIALRMDAFSKKLGGYLRYEDFAQFSPQWVEPICTNYRGYEVWEIPPNGQGIVALMALNILSHFDFDKKDSVRTWHTAIEAIKLAFADGLEYIADPAHMRIGIDTLLSPDYAKTRASHIKERASALCPGTPKDGGTVYLCAADNEGNMISYIQSNFNGFGSGLVIPGTGIALQNRAFGFSFKEGHANCIAPRKRPYHTIIPAFITQNGMPVGPFGVMGGHMQPQGHTQVAMNLIDFAMNTQSALDCPRFRWNSGLNVSIEAFAGDEILAGLSDKGHDLNITPRGSDFGHGQIVRHVGDGFECGTEPRTDGAVCAW